MNKQSNEEFLKEETLVLTDDCRVAGKVCKKGDTVTVSGNDKSQLIASGKAKRQEPKEEKTKKDPEVK